MASEANLAELRAAYQRGAIAKAEFIARMHGEHQRLYAYRDWIRGSNVAGIEIVPDGVQVALRTPPIRLWCPLEDRRAAPVETLNFGDYEPEVFGVVRTLLATLGARANTVVDVGANVGFYAIGLARMFPGISIEAFEPIESTVRWLRANLELNDCPNVRVHGYGLADQEGEATFHTYPSQSVAAARERILDDVPAETVTCRLRTLDSVRVEAGLRVDLMKCDVEGAERMVFAGARATLAEDRPVILTEMLRKWSAKYGYHPNDLIADLKGFGYGCHAIGKAGLRSCPEVTEETEETNFAFLHKEAHAALSDRLP